MRLTEGDGVRGCPGESFEDLDRLPGFICAVRPTLGDVPSRSLEIELLLGGLAERAGVTSFVVPDAAHGDRRSG